MASEIVRPQSKLEANGPEPDSKPQPLGNTTKRRDNSPSPKIRAQPLSVWLGGPYAILLQLAHPGIASASCAHSRFVTEGISRLRRTVAYIISLTHGTEREQKIIARQITKQHSFIKSGKGIGGGCPYDARDQELQKWVAATLFKGMILTDEVFTSSPGSGLVATCQNLGIKHPRTRMNRLEKESLLQEASWLATSLDMPVETWFSCLEEFEEYFDGMLNEGLSFAPGKRLETEPQSSGLSLSETSKKMGHVLLHEMNLPFWLGFWLRPLMRLLVGAWLPEALRREFGVEDLGLGKTTDRHEFGVHPKQNTNLETREKASESWIKSELQIGAFPWTTLMRWTYIALVWLVWLIDWLMPGWLEAWIVEILVRDMRFAAHEIERTGRWPM